MNVVYLDGAELLTIHVRIIQETGGLQGVRDTRLLKSIFERPKMSFGGEELYPDLWRKAAASYEGFAKFHVFVDGNKRTAFLATTRFLHLNGYTLAVTNPQAQDFTLRIVTKKLAIPIIASWLKRHSRKSQ